MSGKTLKKQRGHYCKICGQYRANEKFSGKGRNVHICKDCKKLPLEKRNELQTVNKIINLPFYLGKEQRSWLEKKRKDPREEVRDTAEWAYAMRFDAPPSTIPFESDFPFALNCDPDLDPDFDPTFLYDEELWLDEETLDNSNLLDTIDDLPF